MFGSWGGFAFQSVMPSMAQPIGFGAQFGWGGGGGSFATSGGLFVGGPVGFRAPSGPAGFYYGWSLGGPNGCGFFRNPYAMGTFAWNAAGGGPIQRGAAGVAEMVGSWPIDPGNPAEAWNYMLENFPKAAPSGKTADAAPERHKGAPRSAAGRVGDYYDAAADGRRMSGVYPDYYKGLVTAPDGETREAKRDRLDEYNRESFLFNIAKYFQKKTEGRVGQDYRAQFMRRYKKLKEGDGEIPTERKLLALVDPTADTPSDLGSGVGDLPFPKGYGAGGQTIDERYSSFKSALENQFGGEWRSVVDELYDKQLDAIRAMGEDKYRDKPADRSKIVSELQNEKNFTRKEAEAIYDRAFKGVKSGYDEEEIYKKIRGIRSAPGADIDDGKLVQAVKWYVKRVYNVRDISKIDRVYRKILGKKARKRGFSFVNAMDIVDRAFGKKKSPKHRKNGGKGTDKKATGGKGEHGASGEGRKIKRVRVPGPSNSGDSIIEKIEGVLDRIFGSSSSKDKADRPDASPEPSKPGK